MEEKARSLKMIRGGFRYQKERPAVSRQHDPITYVELIQHLRQNGFEEVQRSQGYVFLHHKQSDSLVALPTRNSHVLPPHLAEAMKVLQESQTF